MEIVKAEIAIAFCFDLKIFCQMYSVCFNKSAVDDKIFLPQFPIFHTVLFCSYVLNIFVVTYQKIAANPLTI